MYGLTLAAAKVARFGEGSLYPSKTAPRLLLGLASTEYAIAHAHQRGVTFQGIMS
jgi:hypothetical protein